MFEDKSRQWLVAYGSVVRGHVRVMIKVGAVKYRHSALR